MATARDVRRIARSLPDAIESTDDLAFAVPNRGKHKGFVWSWKERVEPRKPRVPNLSVLAVRVADEGDKQALLASEPAKFFTEPHYNGFPAVLVRLDAIGSTELRELITDAWRCTAPAALVTSFDERRRSRRKE